MGFPIDKHSCKQDHEEWPRTPELKNTTESHEK